MARALLLALALAFAIAVVSGAGLGDGAGSAEVDAENTTGSGARLGGDYAAFHGAGSIVLAGDVDRLYDPVRQTEAQEGLGIDGYLSFAYPPHVAVAYAPLAALGFRAGYAVHTVVMAGAVLAALWFLRAPVPRLRGHMWPAVAAAIGFYPLFTAVGGGQNTALTLLLFALVWSGLHGGHDVLAGVGAGLLLFRPQYALPLIALMMIARRPRAAGTALAVGAGTWAAVATFMGTAWPIAWIDEVLPFVERDAEVNAHNSISILGFLQAIAGADHPVAVVLGGLGALTVAFILAWLWSRPERYPLAARMGATAVGVLLLSPHTMFYDAGLLVIAGAALVAGTGADGRGSLLVVAAVWLLAFVHLAAPTIGATPLALVVAAVFVITSWKALAAPSPAAMGGRREVVGA